MLKVTVVLKVEERNIVDGQEEVLVRKFVIEPDFEPEKRKEVWDRFEKKARLIAGVEE